jgi:hypothetical protein
MQKRAVRILPKVKGVIRQATWKEYREVEATREARSRLSEADRGVPRGSLKKV